MKNQKTLLLVCDMINDLVHEDGPNGGEKGYGPFLTNNNVLSNAALMISKARTLNLPIGFVRRTIKNVQKFLIYFKEQNNAVYLN